MIQKILLSFASTLIFSMSINIEQSEMNRPIEVFDIERNEVMIRAHMNQAIYHDVENLLEGIDGVVKRINPIPSDGFIVKIPLEPNIMVVNEWLNDLVDEVMIFYSEKDHPYLLVFDQENNSYFFTFNGDAVGLLLKIQ